MRLTGAGVCLTPGAGTRTLDAAVAADILAEKSRFSDDASGRITRGRSTLPRQKRANSVGPGRWRQSTCPGENG